MDTILVIGECLENLRVCMGFGLKVQQARDNLKVVFHPMVDFLQQYLFFFKRSFDLLFRLLTPGNIISHRNQCSAWQPEICPQLSAVRFIFG